MTQQQLFFELLVTAAMFILGGLKVADKQQRALGLFMIAIPTAFWLSRLLSN